MKTPIFTLLLLPYIFKSYTQATIILEDMCRHIGDSVTVSGKISGGQYLDQAKGTPILLNLGEMFPNNTLSIVIWSDVRKQFETPPEVLFKDKEVCVTVRMELYKGKTQIVLGRKEDLRKE